MSSNLERYRTDLENLLKLGDKMDLGLMIRKITDRDKASKETEKQLQILEGGFERDYQRWYTEALVVIHQIIPNRSTEFENIYIGGQQAQGHWYHYIWH